MKRRYLLDTDTCIYLMKRRSSALAERLVATPLEWVSISAITYGELQVGVARSEHRVANLKRLQDFVADIQVRPWDEAAAEAYGEVRARLEGKGTPIGPLDGLIAAHAISVQAVLVTNNVREFRRVKGLEVERWATDLQ